jgi:predicted ATP-binding protein involved in virulence
MKIKELSISNWQVIRESSFLDLNDFVVIAGPNGVGKTKIKDAIVHIFQNGGNPPHGSKVILEATNDEERTAWKTSEFTLPQGLFASLFSKQYKRLKTKSKLIQIDSNRSIDTIEFQRLTFNQIGNPEDEEISFDHGIKDIKTRFQDTCRTLHRLKSKEVTAVYNAYNSKLNPQASTVTVDKLPDSTEKYMKTFNELLHPKEMLPIDINSSTIQYLDEQKERRQFSELSSGEREVVILTFDLLAQDPSDCIILIDEPEVHLHPELSFRLTKTLKSIGERNQFFLFTHSADIIGNSLVTGVHFIRPKSKIKTGNQVARVDEDNIEIFKSIPNIRETIGMVSLGKKLLFVEGNNTSIDRNVFAALAKSSKSDIAIVPSESCSNLNNMSIIAESLEKGIFGIELYMVRDRDGLTDDQVKNFTTKSNNRLLFLPFYHIENAFLSAKAIEVITKKILLSGSKSIAEIEAKIVELAKNQINYLATQYVKSEIYFKAGNFDVSPRLTIDNSTSISSIAAAMDTRKNELLNSYNIEFSKTNIEKNLNEWKTKLESSLVSGWSEDARKIFFGKSILKSLQQWLFGSKNIVIWEHMVSSDDPHCREACVELKSILNKI